MNVSSFISQIKPELDSIQKQIEANNTEMNRLRLSLGALEMETQRLTDTHDALRMALDALELVPADNSAATKPAPSTVFVEKPAANAESAKSHSRKPKKIGKYDPKGVKIGEYSSLNKCAKDFGWSNSSMSKYIENTGKDKQIRLRGYYLEFIAA